MQPNTLQVGDRVLCPGGDVGEIVRIERESIEYIYIVEPEGLDSTSEYKLFSYQVKKVDEERP